MPCHPYEPGFAACVGYEPPPSWNPYLPDVPLEQALLRMEAPPLVDVLPATRVVDDELAAPALWASPAAAVPIPEPAAALLLSLGVLALCARWRARC